MFINCPFCKALVATDPATDLPPEHCPRCAAKLRGLPMDAAAPTASSTVPHVDADSRPAPVFELLEVPEPDIPADTAAPRPVASELATRIHHAVAARPASETIAPIATMLRAPAPDPESKPEAAPESEPAPAAPPVATPPTPDDLDRTKACKLEDAEAATPPTATAEALPPASGDDDAAPISAPAAPQAAPAQASAEGDAPAPEAPAATPAPAAARPAAKPLPSFARGRRGQASGFGWKSGAAIAGLAVLLLLQLLLADRARLAGDARWRPLLANVCGALGCSLPPWREPGAFTVLARDVRPHPSTPGTLRVTATFRNDARWPQPWPRVRLTLSDINGHAVAARDFDARDYLGDAPTQVEVRSGQSASIAMEVVEPAARSVAFDFELH